jgi:hypothetical protein
LLRGDGSGQPVKFSQLTPFIQTFATQDFSLSNGLYEGSYGIVESGDIWNTYGDIVETASDGRKYKYVYARNASYQGGTINMSSPYYFYGAYAQNNINIDGSLLFQPLDANTHFFRLRTVTGSVKLANGITVEVPQSVFQIQSQGSLNYTNNILKAPQIEIYSLGGILMNGLIFDVTPYGGFGSWVDISNTTGPDQTRLPIEKRTIELNNISFIGATRLDLNMNRPSSIASRTLELLNVNFTQNNNTIYSATGRLAQNPNTGAAIVPGHVNYINNVTYHGIAAENHTYDGGAIGTAALGGSSAPIQIQALP